LASSFLRLAKRLQPVSGLLIGTQKFHKIVIDIAYKYHKIFLW